jgi:hypothetical protein
MHDKSPLGGGNAPYICVIWANAKRRLLARDLLNFEHGWNIMSQKMGQPRGVSSQLLANTMKIYPFTNESPVLWYGLHFKTQHIELLSSRHDPSLITRLPDAIPQNPCRQWCLMRGCMMPSICGALKEVVCCHSLFPVMIGRQKCWFWSTIMLVESAEVDGRETPWQTDRGSYWRSFLIEARIDGVSLLCCGRECGQPLRLVQSWALQAFLVSSVSVQLRPEVCRSMMKYTAKL